MSLLGKKTLAIAAVAAGLLNLSCLGAEAEKTPSPAASQAFVVKGATLPVPQPSIPDKTFDVKKYGAVGDGVADDTAAIQKAIAAAGTAGGGKVVLPAGTYLSGPITLVNNLELHLDDGATLKALPMDKYPQAGEKIANFISASKLHDLKLSGGGTIDGQGQAWWDKFRGGAEDMQRPVLIYLSKVERVAVSGLHLQNSPKFHLFLANDKDATVEGLTIAAPESSPNTDGIDIRGENIYVTGCQIAVGDDNIAFGGPATRITITNCKFGHGHGISIGSYTRGGVSDLLADNITFDGTESGIKGKSQRGRGGLVENLKYTNMKMEQVKNPIFFMSFYDEKNKDPNLDTKEPIADMTPMWRNVTIENVTATTLSTDRRNAGILWGSPEAPIENFTLKNVKIISQKPFKLYHVKGITFADDCSITVPQGEPFVTFDASDIRKPAAVPAKAAEKAPAQKEPAAAGKPTGK
jgi:polygalacturonase